MKTWILFIGFLEICAVHGQQLQHMRAAKKGTFYPRAEREDWHISLQNQEAPTPDGKGWKSELLRRKNEIQKRYPRMEYKSAMRNLISGTFPAQGKGFEGNLSGGSTPNDNSVAVSNDGYMVSAINTNLYFYDLNADTLMDDASLSVFMLPTTLVGSKYDPKVIYDNEADRFILSFLNGSSANTSAIVTCFSTSSNPMDPWHVYAIQGNPFNDTSWTDYPAISVNKTDFFVTGNLILSQSGVSWQLGFKQTLIWQVHKQDGYNGEDTLRFGLWSDINYNNQRIRNLHPVRSGRGIYESDQYLLSNRNFSAGSDSIFVVHISDGYLNGNPQLSVQHVNASKQYHLTVNAPQADGQDLATNDSRVLGAIKEGDIVHFVSNTTDTLTGNSAVYHGRLDLSNYTCTANILSDTLLNFGYPNIAYTGVEFGEEESVIAFEYSSVQHNPGIACIYVGNDLQYDSLVIIKEGDSTINMLADNLERWGDYTGIQRVYNQPCKVWFTGTFGNSNRRNATWVARLDVADSCRTLPEPPMEDTITYTGSFDGVLFPNPAREIFSFAFIMEVEEEAEIAVYDMHGRKVKVLMSDLIKQGKNLLSFSTAHLRTGLYVVSVETQSGRKYTRKLVVE